MDHASHLTGWLPRAAPVSRCWRLGSQRPEPSVALHRARSKYAGSNCGLSPLAAERCFSAPPCVLPRLTPASTDALLCTFSAPLSPQVICWMSGPADKLSLPVADARARSGECVRAAVASMGSCELFNPGLFRLSVEFCGDFYMAAGRCAAKQRLTELTSGVVVLKLCISCHNQQPSPAEVATSSDLRSILFHLGVRV